MMIKKWRPFWSYDVEATENWLAQMAADGKRLYGLNRWTRMFAFKSSEHKRVHYQFIFDKSEQPHEPSLERAGWENELAFGHWTLLKNKRDSIHINPIRDGILKRNQLHIAILTGISILLAPNSPFSYS